MKIATRPADIYLRFLHLADDLRSLPSLPALDPLEERILTQVAKAARKSSRLSVRDVMADDRLGSPATIHSRLKSMRRKGWLVLSDTEDTRRKQVDLSPGALQHFDRLSACLVEAAQA